MKIARITLCQGGFHYVGSKLTTVRIEDTAGNVFILEDAYGADIEPWRVAITAEALIKDMKRKSKKKTGGVSKYE